MNASVSLEPRFSISRTTSIPNLSMVSKQLRSNEALSCMVSIRCCWKRDCILSHLGTRRDTPEDHMLSVQPRRCSQSDEELANQGT